MNRDRKENEAPAGDRGPPTEAEAAQAESRGSSLGRLKRLEYKLDHVDEKLADVIQRVSDSPDNEEPTSRLSDEIARRVFDMLQGTRTKVVAAEGATLVDPDQVRMLIGEKTKPLDEHLRRISVMLVDISKRLGDLEAPASKGGARKAPKPREVPEEVQTHPFYPQFKHLGDRMRTLIAAKGWT